MVHGPAEYIPPIEVKVLETRNLIQLAEKEGIYVRNTQSGEVKSIVGRAYMLKAHEELWEMELGPEVEYLLGFRVKRDLLIKEIESITGD